jgi:hypothetical protein
MKDYNIYNLNYIKINSKFQIPKSKNLISNSMMYDIHYCLNSILLDFQ